jgi:hypothetical protein
MSEYLWHREASRRTFSCPSAWTSDHERKREKRRQRQGWPRQGPYSEALQETNTFIILRSCGDIESGLVVLRKDSESEAGRERDEGREGSTWRRDMSAP